jgi:hypothetical protein
VSGEFATPWRIRSKDLAHFYLLKAGDGTGCTGENAFVATAKIVVAAVERAIEQKVPLYVW